MKIDWLEIQNFKRFEKKRVELQPQFTLLVAKNLKNGESIEHI